MTPLDSDSIRVTSAALLVLGVICMAIGAAGIWAAMDLRASGGESTGWRQAKGRVVESRVVTRETLDGSDLSQGRRIPRVEHLTRIRYQYNVGGEEYTSDRVRFGERHAERGDDGRDRAQAAADLYPRGTDVTVYYDPEDPGRATLEPGLQGTPWMWGVGGGALVIGLAMVLGSRRLRRLVTEP